ncbi:NAD(P)-dependent oxidoreductase [Chelatococcus sp. SYSU_G07232]|uniref:precorrin-2 dehydrogenase n=1 Tax=Chelatococcus albus TaxID=3047466 RepID=A0ABT7AMJ5_9HYPH|nr:NAD(P)-dependent oxidoreductase [Chelatococcus sp. SYSU_G07232]MDJ1160029.1 NAD(P)-dependent oxidoreductase [Chelatococcus sp. SYSU_G07232]
MNAPPPLPHRETTAPHHRLAPLATLPVFFRLAGARAVVAGSTPAAAWKAELLSAAGAAVDVFAPGPDATLLALAAHPPAGAIRLHRRAWREADLQGAAIAVADAEDDMQARCFHAAARAAGVPANCIDRPQFCDFRFGAVVNRSPLVVGISTDGAAPVFGQAVRTRIETLLPQGFARWAEAAVRWRPAVGAWAPSPARRRAFWRCFAAAALDRPDYAPGDRDLEAWLAAEDRGPEQNAAPETITVASDDPEELTLRQVRLIQSADIVLYDPDVPHAVLDFARREARKLRSSATALARKGKKTGETFADGLASPRIVRLVAKPAPR